MSDSPILGCSGCATTGGRLGCPTHRQRVFITGGAPTMTTPDPLRAALVRQLVALVRIGFLVTIGNPPRRADLLDVGANPYSALLSDILTATDTDAAVERVLALVADTASLPETANRIMTDPLRAALDAYFEAAVIREWVQRPYSNSVPSCPACGSHDKPNHDPGCWLAVRLAEPRP